VASTLATTPPRRHASHLVTSLVFPCIRSTTTKRHCSRSTSVNIRCGSRATTVSGNDRSTVHVDSLLAQTTHELFFYRQHDILCLVILTETVTNTAQKHRRCYMAVMCNCLCACCGYNGFTEHVPGIHVARGKSSSATKYKRRNMESESSTGIAQRFLLFLPWTARDRPDVDNFVRYRTVVAFAHAHESHALSKRRPSIIIATRATLERAPSYSVV
jgi:hypothetical protein